MIVVYAVMVIGVYAVYLVETQKKPIIKVVL